MRLKQGNKMFVGTIATVYGSTVTFKNGRTQDSND